MFLKNIIDLLCRLERKTTDLKKNKNRKVDCLLLNFWYLIDAEKNS